MKMRGFTLIETVITLVIMAFLTTMAARTIRQSFLNKAKLEDQIDSVSPVKDTLRFMERDIQLAYHYIDIQKELAEELKKAQRAKKSTGNPNTPTPPEFSDGNFNANSATTNPFLSTENRLDPTTHFVAKESELHFVTMNSVRFMKNSPQADFGEVSYFLDECKNRPDKKFNSGKCLFRRFSPVVDSEVTEGGQKTQLLFDVTEFKLKYYSQLQKDWRSDWNSTDRGGDGYTKNRYPEAVEITLTTEAPIKGLTGETKTKKISLQSVISLHFPNNRESPSNSNPSSNPNGNSNTNPPGDQQ